jgi:hemerythrin superfamily protein
MDIYDYLKMDHDKVDHLFQLFEKSTLLKRQQETVALIIQELLVHAHSEQETFYKFLLKFPETKEIALHGEKEHRDIEEQVHLISKASGKQWNDAVLKLKEIVHHHVKEEEGKIFNKAKKVISPEEALIIKEKMHYLKGKFLLLLENKVSAKLKTNKTNGSKRNHLASAPERVITLRPN